MLGRPAQVERPAVHDQQHDRRARSPRRPAAARAGRPGSSSDDRDACFADHVLPLADHDHRDVGVAAARSTARSELGLVVEALGVARARCRRTCRTSTGRAAGPGGPRARSRRRTPSPTLVRMPSRTVTVSSRSKSKHPGPEGVAPRVGQRADHGDRARRPASSGSRSPSLRSSTAERSARDPGHLAVGRVGEHLAGAVLVDVRVVEQAHPELGLEHPPHAGVERLLVDRARARRASGRWAYAGSSIAISRSTPASSARAPASVRSAAKPWVTQVAHGVGVADDEPVEAPGPAQHIGEQPAVAGGRDAVEVHVRRHDVAGAGLDAPP